MILLQLSPSDAVSQVDKAIEASTRSIEASIAMNHMLLAGLIIVGVVTTSVLIVIWNKYQQVLDLYQQKEKEDNEFKSQFLLNLDNATKANQQVATRVDALISKIDNNSMDKLGNQIQSIFLEIAKSKSHQQ